jgi:D-glycerate 3-kinase
LLKSTLSSEPYNLPTVVLSLDDFYLRHEDQVKLAKLHPDNPLIQHRGQPSTHDIQLLASTLSSLHKRNLTKLPSYDKSAFLGAGDRTDPATWDEVNRPGSPVIEVIILEGWCAGFRALSAEKLDQTWHHAKEAIESGAGEGQLGRLKKENVDYVNSALREYDHAWDMFDAFIHIDAEDTRWVYTWRLEAEVKLRREKGSGMTDEQVKRFVDGCEFAECPALYRSL